MSKSVRFAVVLAVICLPVISLSSEAGARSTNSIKREVETSKQARVSALVSNCVPLLVQQNVNVSRFFDRPWAAFKVGFGDPGGDYWLGNDLLSQLTTNDSYKLKFDLLSRSNGNWYHAEYSTFRVLTEADNYTLEVAGYSGNARRDALAYQNGMMFSTRDRDNDRLMLNHCAALRGGGFWYNGCAYCSVNGNRFMGYDFYWYGLPGGSELQTSRMWLQCK